MRGIARHRVRQQRMSYTVGAPERIRVVAGEHPTPDAREANYLWVTTHDTVVRRALQGLLNARFVLRQRACSGVRI